ncbi:protein of unknown function DUF342 [Thermovirga lienii DSM 17291]|uniref:Flagellar Assembly Protein A N-terminal region domain-containing protein n=1 Tax=Thermovirga lienii (strain ATCC BAA-1197 / DSM 17291 / Cas60314) TaxID=580340 RepID=G7V5J9_THELD|nr:protein of unknown function DUF342 [Thermovirga lienii DSM 17291]HCD71686.1 DUF342 domain-containing protein [Thermovirga lienii]
MPPGAKPFELREENGELFLKVSDKSISPVVILEAIKDRGVAISLDSIRDLLNNSNEEWQSVGVKGKRVKVRISEDKLKAEVYLEPAIRNLNAEEAKKEIIRSLEEAGVVFGIKEEVVELLASGNDDNLLEQWIVIAEGIPPEESQDARIDVLVKIAEKGLQELENAVVVDFKALGFIPNVKKGTLIARKIPPKEGKDGKDVFGEPIKVKKPKDINMKAGPNTELSQDGLEITATANGFIVKEGNRFRVEPLLVVRGDVDYGTGNIECFGSIHVTGGVKEDFSVVAGETLEINGVVEGAELRSGKDMRLHSAVRGMERGRIDCGGNLYLEYADQCKITSAGELYFKRALMHCDIEVEGSVHLVEGGKGVIAGGKLYSGGDVECRALGSKVGTKTLVHLGLSPRLMNQHNVLMAKKEDLESKIATVKKNIKYLTRLAEEGKLDEKKKLLALNFVKLLESFELKHKEVESLLLKVEELIKKAKHKGRVKVREVCYPGVTIVIRRERYQVREELKEVEFLYEDGKVKVVPIDDDR